MDLLAIKLTRVQLLESDSQKENFFCESPSPEVNGLVFTRPERVLIKVHVSKPKQP